MAHVKIKLERHGSGRLWIDGVEIPNAYGVNFKAHVNETNKVSFHLHAEKVDIEADECEIVPDVETYDA